ncbi:myb-like protein Q [Teleopsis dalmanni]|uniref:myb-like protein Q n=1 Tax=Teleopsis dalmanni TaxID=139649 RepID=UPI0018CEA3D6|nr:myb-like protein Q [Teleopsis dalmanni]
MHAEVQPQQTSTQVTISPAHVSSPLTLSTSQQQQPQTPSTPSHHLSGILNETANSNDSSTLAVAANDSNNSNNSSSNSSTNSIVNNQPTMPLQNTMRLISMTPVRIEDIYSRGPVSPVRNQQQSNQQHNQSIDKQTTAEVNKIATSKTASLSKPKQAPCKCLVPPSHDPKANKEIQEFQIPEAQRQRNLKHIEENPKVFSLQRYTQDRQESQTQIQKAQRQQRPRYIKQNLKVFHPIRVIPDQVQAHEIQPQQVPQRVTPIEENKPGLSKHRISNAYSTQDHVNLQLQIQDVQQPREQKRQIEEHDLSSRPTLPQRLTIVPESSHCHSHSNFKSSSQTTQCHTQSDFKSSLQPKELEPQPPYPVNPQQAPREAPPRDNHQSGPSSSSSSTTSPQRNSTTVQPVSNNRHVQPTNSLDPLDINVLDSNLNMELSSQETQAKDKVKRDSQQEPWSPQEEWNVVQPSKKGNKPETLSPKKRKRNRASF